MFVYFLPMAITVLALVGKILGIVANPAFELLARQEKVIRLRHEFDLGGDFPKPTFASVFAFAMLEYAVDASAATIALFKDNDVQRILRAAFTQDDLQTLSAEVAIFLQRYRLGDDLRASGCDAKVELERFQILFWKWAERSRTPAEARSVQQLNRVESKVDTLLAGAVPSSGTEWTLETELSAWFRALGHSFESHQLREKGAFEWLLNVRSHRAFVRVLVRGVRGEIKAGDVEAARDSVTAQRAQEGWLVTDRRISQGALKAAGAASNIFCYTLDELIEQNANWEPYLDWLEAEVLRLRLPDLYVPIGCTKDERAEKSLPASRSYYGEAEGYTEGYLDRWLADPAKEHISILGEFGTGKTWVALHYAWVLLRRYRDAQRRGTTRPRVPVIVSLRDYAKAVSLESLFSDFFFRKHELRLPSYAAFERLNRMGKLLLIFDGFDEMAARIDRQKMIDNFWELAKAVVPGSKVLLTCRTEHFPEAREGRKLLNAELMASTAKLTGEPPQFEVLDLEKLSPKQIRQTLEKRGASEGSIKRILSDKDLADLATRPVMADLLIEALPDIEANRPVDLARVYLYAIRRKVERDIKDERTFTSTADKFYFLAELCWEMWTTDQLSLNYRQFPEHIRRLFGSRVAEQKELDHWHYDMMGQTLLVRNADGDYAPAHRSFMEFFVAYKICAELGLLAEEFVEPARQSAHVTARAEPIDYTWTTYFRSRYANKTPKSTRAPLRSFVCEEDTYLVTTLGIKPLTDPTKNLLVTMLTGTDMGTREILLALIWRSRATKDSSHWLGGNAATILTRLDQASLMGQDLSNCNLQSADLSRTNLCNIVCKNCNLREINVDGANLQNADLSGSDMSGAELFFDSSYWRLTYLDNIEIFVISYDDDFPYSFDYYKDRENFQYVYAAAVETEFKFNLLCFKNKKFLWGIHFKDGVLEYEIDSKNEIIGLLTLESMSIYFLDIQTGELTQGSNNHPLYRWKGANLASVTGLAPSELTFVRRLGALNVPDRTS